MRLACHGSNLAVDVFEHRSYHYLLVADYFCKFPVVKKLANQTASHVIGLLKMKFAECVVPANAYTDQVTQFMSKSSINLPSNTVQSTALKPKLSSVKWFY